jgi:hypothetical protein
MGPLKFGYEGEVTETELAPWEAMDVAAVDMRVSTVPEFVDEDVSRFRLIAEGLDGSDCRPPWSSASCCLSISFSSCRFFW